MPQRQSPLLVDITNNACTLLMMGGELTSAQQRQRQGGLTLLDEAIMNMITLETSAVPALRALVQMDGESGIANSLLAFELLRHSVYHETLPDLIDAEICACLESLERNADVITRREVFFGAAAMEWRRGNYRKAGALLESSLLSCPEGDAVALRLAQDCYLAAGDSKNVLACVTRCLQLMDQKNLLHGHLLGMLAVGYVETGRLVDAEEAANRAIQRTNGRDIWAVLSLLNAYQLTGRSSEIIATLDEHLEKHESLGHYSLLFSKGCALAQRGNCRGALRVYDTLVAYLQQSDERTATLLVQATFLFWQISLHEVNHQVGSRWPLLASMWVNVAIPQKSQHPPLVELCKTMALAGFLNTSSQVRIPGRGQSRGQSSPDSSIDLPEGGRIHTGSASAASSSLVSASPSQPDMLAWVWEGFQGAIQAKKPPSQEDAAAAEAKVAESEKQAALDTEALVAFAQRHVAEVVVRVQALPGAGGEGARVSGRGVESTTRPHFSKLQSIQPSFHLAASTIELSSFLGEVCGRSERDWAMATCGIPIAHGLALFEESGDGVATTASLLNTHQTAVSRLGGTLALRDVIQQTLIEAMLRSEQWAEARLLLSERTTLAPNDAQAWRRQASVLGRLGLKDLAEVANYTAWQLGIGQGGFGGPR